ncbi:MAG: SMEK domain-containing protein [Cyclobacterium sp.]|uniref:SMEK domain-containing protein n=1 Tax=Cyclobacterium sp. TaxID=1966343 RepID=UPI003970B785
MNEHEELVQIRRLIGIWLNEIHLANAEFYFDINKVSENLCRQLLNLVYGYELVDLNDKENPNFPGLDIGDKDFSKIAFQITSRSDRYKVIKNLQTVISNGYEKVFDCGIKFLILKLEGRVTFTKKNDPTKILPSFDPDRDIIYPEDIIKKIQAIYETEGDLIKFNKIKGLLEKELYPKFPSHIIQEQAKEIKTLIQKMEMSTEKGSPGDFRTSVDYFDIDLQPPIYKNLIPRETLIKEYLYLLAEKSILWVKGPFSTGKTSIAVSVCQSLSKNVIWLECRVITEKQLVDHLLNSLSAFLKIRRTPNFRQMVVDLIAALPEETLLVLNDVAQFSQIEGYEDQILFFLFELEASGHRVLVTSNFSPPEIFTYKYGLGIVSKNIPPFLPSETAQLLQTYKASPEISEVLSVHITSSTQGHPLLIRSAAKYLSERNWNIKDEELVAIFTGKFDPSTDKATYAKLLHETSDVKTVELLYRLKYIIGSFSSTIVHAVAQVDPVIDRVGERLNELSEIWLQQNSNGKYLVSPLIKHLDDNVNQEVKKGIYLVVAKSILSSKPVSPIDASSVILYYLVAKDHNNAALVLIKLLHAFAESPELFFEWGLHIHWFHNRLPKEINPHLKVQIRLGQIQIAKTTDKDTELQFLREDLISILNDEDIGLIDRYLANMALFQIDFKRYPLKAMDELKQIQEDEKELQSNEAFTKRLQEDGLVLLDDLLLNAIWMIFAQISSISEYHSWFEKLAPSYPESITDPQDNEAYAMAGASIYRNVKAVNQDSGNSIEILTLLLEKSEEKELDLIAAYAIKYLVKYKVEKNNDLDGAISLVEGYQELMGRSHIYDYLVKAELGAMCLLKGERQQAFDYLSPLREAGLPVFYIEQLDYLIAAMQVYFDKDKEISAALSSRALEFSKSNQSILNIDKFKLYGEGAIGLVHTSRTKEALNLLAEGYKKVLNEFIDNDEYKGVIIRYGNTIMYVVQILIYQKPIDFGDKKKFVIPEPGFFYRSNDALLEGGFYFEERKYMVATLITDGFEEMLDFENARKWAYKAVELITSLLEEPRFIAIIQKFVFYPVNDRRYLQGYNMLAEVQCFYQRIVKKVEDGHASKEETEIVEKAVASRSLSCDIGIYLYILFPVALDFSLSILSGKMKRDDYRTHIDAVFDTGKYNTVDPEEFAYAKSVFEKIMLDGIDYSGFMDIHRKITSSNKDFVYAIGCFLLGTFSNPTEAANLHLANLITLDDTFKKTIKSFYNFQVIPYFENFWKLKFQNDPRAFLHADHLLERGFPLIEKTAPYKRIKKIFSVLSHHLPISFSPEIENFIDTED